MRFAVGDAVRVRNDWPESAGPAHVRTPHYLRGHKGRVIRQLGVFANPEDLAFERPASMRPLYHVAFDPETLWTGSTAGEVLVELYEHWLEPEP